MQYVAVQYVKVQWHHEFPDEPVLFYSELGPDRFETRKVQIHRDGRMEWADERHETDTAVLSEIAFPPLEEIAADPEFTPQEIDARQFEEIWRRALTQ